MNNSYTKLRKGLIKKVFSFENSKKLLTHVFAWQIVLLIFKFNTFFNESLEVYMVFI